MIIAVTSMLLLNAIYIKSLYGTFEPISYLSKKIDRDSYIKKFRPEYEVINFANRKLAKNATILCLFIGDRIYYFEKPIFLDINLLKQAVMTSDTSSKIRGNLQQVGITHIILRYDLTDAWIRNSLDANKRMMIKEFIRNYVRPIHSYGGYGLFELVPPG